jgi:hypothetical protein
VKILNDVFIRNELLYDSQINNKHKFKQKPRGYNSHLKYIVNCVQKVDNFYISVLVFNLNKFESLRLTLYYIFNTTLKQCV